MNIGIGTKVWVRDRYARHPQTMEHAREQYSENVIVAETRTSWIVDTSADHYARWSKPNCKIDKKTLRPREPIAITFDLQTVDDAWKAQVYRSRHQHNIQTCMWKADLATLKEIAALLGYDDGEPK